MAQGRDRGRRQARRLRGLTPPTLTDKPGHAPGFVIGGWPWQYARMTHPADILQRLHLDLLVDEVLAAGVSKATATRDLAELIACDQLQRDGTGKASRYRLRRFG